MPKLNIHQLALELGFGFCGVSTCKAMMLSAANDYWRQYHS
jgi:hypothetical protein